MISEILIAIARTLRPVAGILLVLTWWPHRKSGRLNAVPWIVLYLAFSDAARKWSVLGSGRMMRAQGAADGITPAVYDYLVFIAFLAQARYFLIAVMVAINIAFVMRDAGPLNRFQAFLARQQRFQHALGALLLFLMIAPGVGWIASLWIAK